MSVIDRIKAHAQPTVRRRIEVPEWGEPAVLDAEGVETTPAQPLVIFYDMVSLADMTAIRAIAPNDIGRQEAEIVCVKAMDEKGNPLFKRMDAVTLMTSAAPEVVHRVANEMMARKSSEDVEKN